VKVIISQFAEDSLSDIYSFYKTNASVTVAKKIKKSVVGEIKKLPRFIRKNTKEEFLDEKNGEFRKCIVGNYKIVYSIINEQTILITDIFDSRQNPNKIKG
jgi:plasmid stabilization system protein ParE